MNEKLSSLIRKIILGTTVAGTAYAGTSANIDYIERSGLENDKTLKENDVKKAKHPAFILDKPSAKNFMRYLFHRSHRSHSSHRSHYSHYSSYTNEKDTVKKEPTKKQNVTKPSNQNDQNNQIYEFGTRTLTRGMTGTDVVELQELLNKKGYDLKLDGEFGESTEIAVKDFQRKNDLTETGVVNVTTIYFLRK